VDGGAAKSDLLCQFLADVSGMAIHRPQELERTALGVGFLAGISVGMWDGPHDVEAAWHEDRVFEPHISDVYREHLYGGWLEAVDRTLTTRAHSAGAHVHGRHQIPEGAAT
jgi:glycerol kinase